MQTGKRNTLATGHQECRANHSETLTALVSTSMTVLSDRCKNAPATTLPAVIKTILTPVFLFPSVLIAKTFCRLARSWISKHRVVKTACLLLKTNFLIAPASLKHARKSSVTNGLHIASTNLAPVNVTAS